jgi:hypothetical protein
MPAFDKAIEHTITAINTGCLRDRDGTTLAQAKGKAYLENPLWRQQMDTVVELLRAIRSRYNLGVKLGLIHIGEEFFCINDGRTTEWMDQTREEILRVFGKVAEEAGVMAPQWPGKSRRSQR